MNNKRMVAGLLSVALVAGLCPSLAMAAADGGDLQATAPQLAVQDVKTDISGFKVSFIDDQHASATDDWALYFVEGEKEAVVPAIQLEAADGQVYDSASFTVKYEKESSPGSDSFTEVAPPLGVGTYRLTITGNEEAGYTGSIVDIWVDVADDSNLESQYTDMYFDAVSGVIDDRINGMNPNYHVVPAASAEKYLNSLKVRVGGESDSPENAHNGRLLAKGRDYTVAFFKADRALRENPTLLEPTIASEALSATPTTAGSYLLQVRGTGSYHGTCEVFFDIQDDMNAVEVAAIPEQAYTGSAIRPKLVVTYKGQTLLEGTDYHVEYRNNTNVGRASIVVTGANPVMLWGFKMGGNGPEVTWTPEGSDRFFSGTKTVTFDITALAKGETVTIGSGATAAKVKAVSDHEVAYVAPKSEKTKQVKVPDVVEVNGVTSQVAVVAAGAFKGSKATSITVGKNVITVEQGAFANTKKLTKLTLGKNVKTIGKNALKGSKVKTVTLKSSQVTKQSFKNLVKGSKVKTVKLSGVSKKAKRDYKKWAKSLGISAR